MLRSRGLVRDVRNGEVGVCSSSVSVCVTSALTGAAVQLRSRRHALSLRVSFCVVALRAHRRRCSQKKTPGYISKFLGYVAIISSSLSRVTASVVRYLLGYAEVGDRGGAGSVADEGGKGRSLRSVLAARVDEACMMLLHKLRLPLQADLCTHGRSCLQYVLAVSFYVFGGAVGRSINLLNWLIRDRSIDCHWDSFLSQFD